MTAKHFSEYQKRFLGRSNPYKTCYLENTIFEILGHSDLKTRFWNFDPQNRPLRSSQKLEIPFLGKIVKSIFLDQFWADLGIWGVKSCARAFLTFSSLIHVKIRFHEFSTAKIRFLSYFWCKNITFQIDEMVSECPKIMIFPKSSLYTFSSLKAMGNRLGNSEKWSGHSKMVFRALFDSCSEHYEAKKCYFCVFLMFFEDFARSQLLGSVSRRCTGAQESEKIKIAKNGPKHSKTIIQCHI